MHLEVKEYKREEVELMDSLLRYKVNYYKNECERQQVRFLSYKAVFKKAYECYDSSVKDFPWFRYRNQSLKPVLMSSVVAHLGFMGHYNPFTGEAQVNTDVPNFLLPFTTCHEIAHQVGYAKEYEANFAGFLAARHSNNAYFLYSTYLDMYLYTNGELYRFDSTLAKESRKQLNKSIVADLETWKKYRDAHHSPLEPVAESVYGTFLKLNEQPAGIKSYNKVVLWLIAYYKKNGKEAI
jgi:hypothetical protein